MPTGGNALLAETVEDTTRPLDTFVSEMGGTILRRPLDEVVAEMEAQQAAAEEAEKAARKAIQPSDTAVPAAPGEHRQGSVAPGPFGIKDLDPNGSGPSPRHGRGTAAKACRPTISR